MKRFMERAGRLAAIMTVFLFTVTVYAETPAEDSWVGSKAGDRKVVSIRGVEYALRWCPAGTFQMGSPSSETGRFSDETQHSVTLTKGFWMLETEVTQEQWESLMGSNPSWFSASGGVKEVVSGSTKRFPVESLMGRNPSWFSASGGVKEVVSESTKRFPVESVSWTDCDAFVKKLNAELKVSGVEFSLPTEAQWEYACRAGTPGPHAGDLDAMAWYTSNSGERTHEVGSKSPNPWGLYDMHGNVWEWCADWYGDYPSGIATDPVGSNRGEYRVARSGCWCLDASYCRSAYRSIGDPSGRIYYLGLRLVVRQVK